MSSVPFDPHTSYLHLLDSGDALPVVADQSFWSQGVHELSGGRLITAFRCDVDWDHWEMHPAGDEVVLALAGSCDFVLEKAGGASRRILLSAGHMLVVPKGIWHRVEVISPADLLFMTPGDGTEHRPV